MYLTSNCCAFIVTNKHRNHIFVHSIEWSNQITKIGQFELSIPIYLQFLSVSRKELNSIYEICDIGTQRVFHTPHIVLLYNKTIYEMKPIQRPLSHRCPGNYSVVSPRHNSDLSETLAHVRRKWRGNQLSTSNKFDHDAWHNIEEQAASKYIAHVRN